MTGGLTKKKYLINVFVLGPYNIKKKKKKKIPNNVFVLGPYNINKFGKSEIVIPK